MFCIFENKANCKQSILKYSVQYVVRLSSSKDFISVYEYIKMAASHYVACMNYSCTYIVYRNRFGNR